MLVERQLRVHNKHIELAINELSELCHDESKRVGWQRIPATLWKFPLFRMFRKATLISLMHSELSEALEGVRKDCQDKHLPNRKQEEVELSDAIIRICDYAGNYDLDLGGALMEKLEYNRNRADHKKENRDKAGGKKF